jgi:hypothetical protein
VIADSAAGQPPILIGHSRAGPPLATAGMMLEEGVKGYVFVDSRLPAPGRSWMETVSPGLAARMREMAELQGWLPPWPQWWGEEELAALLPDPAVRRSGRPAAFRNRVPPAADGHVRGDLPARTKVAERSLWLSPAQRGIRRRRGQARELG